MERNVNEIIETMERSLNQIEMENDDPDRAKDDDQRYKLQESKLETLIQGLSQQNLQQRPHVDIDCVKMGQRMEDTQISPSPLNSSLTSYCYDDNEGSISLSPLPPIAGTSKHVSETGAERATTGYVSAPSSLASPLNVHQQYHQHQQFEQQRQYSKLPTEIVPTVGLVHQDADKASINSSLMEYTFADEEMASGYSDGIANATLLNTTINTYEHYDHDDSLKRYSEENEEQEEKREICKTDTKPNPHYMRAKYAESPVYKPENKADYVQELYRKVIAANHSNSDKQLQNRPSALEVLNGCVMHENVTAYNHMFRGRKRNDKGINSEDSPGDNYDGCIPIWLINSTPMIKFIIVISSALLIGSLALIGIALSVSMNSDASSIGSSQQTSYQNTKAPTPLSFTLSRPTTSPSQHSSSYPSNSPTMTSSTEHPSMHPTMSHFPSPSPMKNETDKLKPIKAPSKTKSPTIAPSSRPLQQPSPHPTIYPSPLPTKEPSSAPSFSPTTNPTLLPTNLPTIPPTKVPNSDSNPPTTPSGTAQSRTGGEPTIGEFYVFSRTNHKLNGSSIAKLPRLNNEWLVHLGNWNNHATKQVSCPEQRYQKVADIYNQSPIPVLWVPGDNEWNDCENYPTSKQYWRENFVGFESKQHYESRQPFEQFERQNKRQENFSFLFRKVLYVGLNVVGGKVKDEEEWAERLSDNINFLQDKVTSVSDDELDVVVIFGNTGNISSNNHFFKSLDNLVQEWNSNKGTRERKTKNTHALPVFYIKESDNNSRLKRKFIQAEDLILVNVKAGQWPPAKISIDTAGGTFTYNDEWSLEYLN